MADNDRFLIIKEDENIKGIGNKGKTRAKYEDIILQTINKELDKVLKNGEKINNIGLAKAVVDRLFGEGE